MSIPLNSAAAAAWRVNTAPALVSEILHATDYQNVALIWPHGGGWRVVKILVGMPRLTRGRVEDNFIAGVNLRARMGVAPMIFCKHSFLHGLPPYAASMQAHAFSYISRPLSVRLSTDSMGDGLKY